MDKISKQEAATLVLKGTGGRPRTTNMLQNLESMEINDFCVFRKGVDYSDPRQVAYNAHHLRKRGMQFKTNQLADDTGVLVIRLK